MPDRKASGNRSPEDRTPAQREADHASLALLSDTLVPALMDKLAASGLGELEVREGSWRIRLRRPLSSAPGSGRRGDRGRGMARADHEARPGRDGYPAGTPHGAGASVEADASPPADELPEEPWATDEPYGTGEAARSVATSPTVGVFRPEVAVGTRVQAGDRVGVVDLLGIPQDVPSPIDGILVEVFPAAGEAVEFGEAIAAVEGDPPAPGQAPEVDVPDATGSSSPRDASDAADPVARAVAASAAPDREQG